MSRGLSSENIHPDDWMSQAEAAELRGVSRQAIAHLVRKGRFRTLAIGGRTLLYRPDVEMYEPDKGGRPPVQSEDDDNDGVG